MKKNEIVQLTIEDYTDEGLGIGHAQGMAVFVKDTVIGDEAEVGIVKVKKTYAFGRLIRLIRPGADRTEARCAVAAPCGGCQLQMMQYPAQLEWKRRKVCGCLERIGHFPAGSLEVQSVLGMEEPWHYRNKQQYPVGRDREGRPVIGYYAGRSHRLGPMDGCLLGREKDRKIAGIVLSWMERFGIEPYDETDGSGWLRHIYIRSAQATGQIMLCLVVNQEPGAGEAVSAVPGTEELTGRLQAVDGFTSLVINYNPHQTNVILGETCETVWGQPYIEDRIDDLRYHISAQSFYQVNPAQTRVLYGTVRSLAALTGSETVWDLYCGIGTISLYLARQAGQVCGIEVVEQAVADAAENARLNSITNARFFAGRAEEVLPRKIREGIPAADLIVVDPPRKGCDAALLQTMLESGAPRIIYVSCDPATLARDLRILCDGGYEIRQVQPVDMFPQTVHTECVTLLVKS